VAVAPVMRLSMCFDHRVIDGAEAADLLADAVSELENLPGVEAPLASAERRGPA